MPTRPSAAWLGRGRSQREETTLGQTAARQLIAGDLDGALATAQAGCRSRDGLTRNEAYEALAWTHLARGERAEAEAAAGVVRLTRTRDRPLTVALVVTSGGPTRGAASALADSFAILSLVGLTRVLAGRSRLDDVLVEIDASPPGLRVAALEALLVGLMAVGRRAERDAVVERLAAAGTDAERYIGYASVLGEQDFPELAAGYLGIAADRGFADVAGLDAAEHLDHVRARPDFEALRAAVVANAGQTRAEHEPAPADGPHGTARRLPRKPSHDRLRPG